MSSQVFIFRHTLHLSCTCCPSRSFVFLVVFPLSFLGESVAVKEEIKDRYRMFADLSRVFEEARFV